MSCPSHQRSGDDLPSFRGISLGHVLLLFGMSDDRITAFRLVDTVLKFLITAKGNEVARVVHDGEVPV